MNADAQHGEQIITTAQGIRFVVKDTKRHGRGVFAVEPIPKRALIKTFSGDRMSSDVCSDMVKRGLVHNDDPLQIGSFEFLVLDATSYFFNHSCDPNSAFQGECDLFALRDISAGEEIVFDYSTTVSTTVPISEWILDCKCGSANCRQRIGHVLTLPLDQIILYLKQGAFQTYMLKELQQLGAMLRNHDGN